MTDTTSVVRLSSFGSGLDSDIAAGKYIGRGEYSLFDEPGNIIDKKDIAKAVRERSAGITAKKSSFRVIVALPWEGYEQAFAELQAECAERYDRYLIALHPYNDVGDTGNPHAHILVFNTKGCPFRKLSEVHRLKAVLVDRNKAVGLSFGTDDDPTPRIVETQAEDHLRQRGVDIWKDAFRVPITEALWEGHNFASFEAALNKRGFTISTETKNKKGEDANMTIMNSGGDRLRMASLFDSRFKNRTAITNMYIKYGGELTMEQIKKKDEKGTDTKTNRVTEKAGATDLQNTAMQAGGHAVRGVSGIVQAGEKDVTAVAGAVLSTGANIAMTALPLLLKLAREKGHVTEEDIIKAAEAEKTTTKPAEDLQEHRGVGETPQGFESIETIDDTAANAGERRHGQDRREGHERREGVEAGSDGGFEVVETDSGRDAHKPRPNPAQDEADRLKKANAEAEAVAEALTKKNMDLQAQVEARPRNLGEIIQRTRVSTLDELAAVLKSQGIEMTVKRPGMFGSASVVLTDVNGTQVKAPLAHVEAALKAQAPGASQQVGKFDTVEQLQDRVQSVMQQYNPASLERLKELCAKDGIKMTISKSVIAFTGSGVFKVMQRPAVEAALQSGAALFAAPIQDNGEARREEMAVGHGYELMGLLESVDAKLQNAPGAAGPGRTPNIKPDLHR